jgi:hypothetical protein
MFGIVAPAIGLLSAPFDDTCQLVCLLYVQRLQSHEGGPKAKCEVVHKLQRRINNIREIVYFRLRPV